MTGGLILAAKSGEAAKAGPIGLAIILILCIACYFLFKSMSRHMKNVRENFPADGTVDSHGRPVAAPVTTAGAASDAPRATPVATPRAESSAEVGEAGPAADGGTPPA